MQCVTSPSRQASARPIERPVSARYMPISSGSRASTQPTPSSGNRPMPHLGHGEAVALARHAMRAVERDADAGAHHHAVHQRHRGLGEAVELPVERVFRRQQAARLVEVLRPHSAISRTSPPAQNARSVADTTSAAYTCGSRAQAANAPAISARMAAVSALSACGRLSVDHAGGALDAGTRGRAPARRRTAMPRSSCPGLARSLPQVFPGTSREGAIPSDRHNFANA